ncbi:peptidyl-prolyl cis-trans isomerase 7-like [Dysidea avara]|uniref:peptidyl-prolyl cis-trans isomerase 7-like n=1 Tax=Dysidea avara TaxID=196820 RepID=UPI00331C020A
MKEIRLVGVVNDHGFQKTKFSLDVLLQRNPDEFSPVTVESLMEFQWCLFVDEMKRLYKGVAWNNAVVFDGDELIGNADQFLQWAVDNYGYKDTRPGLFYTVVAQEAYKTYINDRKQRDVTYLDISVEGELLGRLVIELYIKTCPKTCANFKALCTAEKGVSESTGVHLSYLNSLIHRIVPGGWVQGGDIIDGAGSGGESIYGKTFDDECYAVQHNGRGIVGMVNCGHNTNSSQFYITLKATPWMNTNYVAFGRVIEGYEVLNKLEKLSTYNERPQEKCLISNCGIYQP